ncbi:hypothetical protein SprV_0100281400 [Sparganum proliferum]
MPCKPPRWKPSAARAVSTRIGLIAMKKKSILFSEKHKLHATYTVDGINASKTACYRCRRLARQRLRETLDGWLACIVERCANHGEMKKSFAAIKAVYSLHAKTAASLLSPDEVTLLTEKSQLLDCWKAHVQGVFSHPSAICEDAINRLPQVDTNDDLDRLPSQSSAVDVQWRSTRIRRISSRNLQSPQPEPHRKMFIATS